MAVDFMVMPLSRYLSGDFVTPLMRWNWDNGTRYFILGPEGQRDLPPNVPFGGESASANRARFVPMIIDDLKSLPGAPWDELSSAEPCFHRPASASYGVLLDHCAAPPASRWFGLRKAATLHHLPLSIFFPGDFAEPYAMDSPFTERVVGSVPRALHELERTSWPSDANEAVECLRDALTDAKRLHLPLIVDT